VSLERSIDRRKVRRGSMRPRSVTGDPEYKRRMRYVSWARKRSKKAGIECSIDVEDITLPTHCPILGIELRYGGDGTGIAAPNSATLDRIDSRKGYVPGNVAIISNRANVLKNNATPDELQSICNFVRLHVG
jgi:hypothetical protein